MTIMGADDAGAASFSRRLAALKRQGCNVLVVNDPGSAAAACERLLGAPELDRRHLFVPTTASVADVLDRHRPRRSDPAYFGVVDATGGSQTRSATASASQESLGPSVNTGTDWYSSVDNLSDFDTLYNEIKDHLDRIAADVETPGDVRVCVDSLDPFFDLIAHGSVHDDGVTEEEFFRFLHLLTSTIREVTGMGHFHVAAEIDEPRMQLVEPLFDATIYVDTDDEGTARQRWRLHESGQITEWFPLD